jgi:hypothetical protein
MSWNPRCGWSTGEPGQEADKEAERKGFFAVPPERWKEIVYFSCVTI